MRVSQKESSKMIEHACIYECGMQLVSHIWAGAFALRHQSHIDDTIDGREKL